MKLFFDTNVIIDALTDRENSSARSRELIGFLLSGKIEGFICSKQVTDIYYILKKYYKDQYEVMKFIKLICKTFEILPLLGSDIQYCLNSDNRDFEDSILDEVASVHMVGNIVTNNVKHFAHSKCVVYEPKDLYLLLTIEQ